jgi:hypothetical protein
MFPASGQDSIRFSGQLSSWLNVNSGSDFPVWAGIRYIPQLNYGLKPGKTGKFDAEFSLNLYGSAGMNPFDSITASARVKPYRAWVRYSTDQLEVRLGLQKLNFGSASILRPLMWFDQVDPRDPLKLTDGVWGLLGRYYFLNNANIWLWGLYGNKDPRGWEYAGTNNRYPEAGGRIQLPIPSGEAAISYNFRIADTRGPLFFAQSAKVPENKIGFDVKLDLTVGLWFEGSWVNKNEDLRLFTNQEILNAGVDYTFGVGNGIYVIFEQLLMAFDEKPFRFEYTTSFSLMSVSYPVSLFDNISGIVYFDWKNHKAYNFVNWQRQFKNIILYCIGYWNPEQYNIPAQGSGQNLFAGKGIQVMLVFNH